jgi:hypothetical protein
VQGIEVARYDKQHGDTKTENAIGKQVFGKTGDGQRIFHLCKGLQVIIGHIVPVHIYEQQHGQEAVKPEFGTQKRRHGIGLVKQI